MAAKRPDIVAEIAAAIPRRNQSNVPWWERTPAQHADTLAAIHDAWHRGDFGSRKITAARVISASLSQLGIAIGPQGVLAWLARPPRS